jgi:hypothetical protein
MSIAYYLFPQNVCKSHTDFHYSADGSALVSSPSKAKLKKRKVTTSVVGSVTAKAPEMRLRILLYLIN